jgi:hypothetical protein
MTLSRISGWLAMAAVVLLGDAAFVHATIMVEVPLDALVLRADLAIRGTVVRTGTRVSIDDGVLVPKTHVWIRVDEVLAGKLPSPVVHLIEQGGRYEGVETVVSGSARYQMGEEVVVFLTRLLGPNDVYSTLEMTQGKFKVLTDANSGSRLMVRDYSEVSMARWRRKRLEISEDSAPKPIPLAVLKSRVRALGLATDEASDRPTKVQP